MRIHTPQCYRTLVIILAAQHPCIGGILHLMDGLCGRLRAEAENLPLPTLLLWLQRVAWAQPIHSLTQEQGPQEAIPVAAAEASTLQGRAGRACVPIGWRVVAWGPGHSLGFLPSCLPSSI